MAKQKLTSVRKVKQRLTRFAAKYGRGAAYALRHLGREERKQMATAIRIRRAEGRRV